MKLTLQIPDIDYEITHGGKLVMEGTLPAFSAVGYSDVDTVKSLEGLIASMIISRLKEDINRLEAEMLLPDDPRTEMERLMSQLREIKRMPGSDAQKGYRRKQS